MKKIFLQTFLIVTLFLTAGCIVSWAPSNLYVNAELGVTRNFDISVYPTPPESIEWELKTVSGTLLQAAQNTPTFQFTPGGRHAGMLLTLNVVETHLMCQPPASMDGSNTVTWYILVDKM